MKLYIKASTNSDKWVIVNKDEKEKTYRGKKSQYNHLFIGAQKTGSHYYPSFTSASRNNYERAKLFNSKEEAEAFVANAQKTKQLFKYTPVEIIPYDEAMAAIGDPDEAEKAYRTQQAEERKRYSESYQKRYKEQHANDKVKDPGKYKVWFYYADSGLGGESFTVDADSIDDAFKKAKAKALKQDPYRNASGYDQRMIFNKNSIRKISD